MKKILLVALVLLCQNLLHAQSDTIPVRGIYSNYQEFLANKPSILVNFSATLLTISRTDPTVIGAAFEIPDSADNAMVGNIWGFCDGKDFFVSCNTPFVLRYWKIQCKGPNPYFYYTHKEFFFPPSITGIILTTISIAAPPYCDIMFIDKEGKSKYSNKMNLKRLVKDNQPLFKELKNEIELSDKSARQYIVRYNESKMNEIK